LGEGFTWKAILDGEPLQLGKERTVLLISLLLPAGVTTAYRKGCFVHLGEEQLICIEIAPGRSLKALGLIFLIQRTVPALAICVHSALF
jgi:hypothetical protein